MAARTIIVTAYAKAEREPDTVSFGFGVQVRSRNTAEEASAKCEASARSIIAALVAQGIEERVISTTSVSTIILRERESERAPYVTYYECSRDYSVKLPKAMFNLAESGIRIAMSKGANSIRNLEWSLSDGPAEELRLKAYGNAAAKAQAKAQLLVTSLGASLGRVKNIDDTPYQRPRQHGGTENKGGGSSGVNEASAAGAAYKRQPFTESAELVSATSSMPQGVITEAAHVTAEYEIGPAPVSQAIKSGYY